MADYCTLDELKSYCQITDTSNDDILSFMIAAATQALVDWMGRDPQAHTATEYYNGTGACVLGLNNVPIQAVTSVAIDTAVLDSSQFYWDDYCIYTGALNTSGQPISYSGYPFGNALFRRGYKNIQVVYIGGYDPLPSPIKLACLMTAKAMWSGRTADQNATGENYIGVMSQQFWQGGPGAIPPQAMAMCQRYKVFLLSV